MPKTTATYWNPLHPGNREQWKPVEGLEGTAEELTLSIDHGTGEYTRLTRFLPVPTLRGSAARAISIPRKCSS